MPLSTKDILNNNIGIENKHNSLTNRELEYLSLVALGYMNKKIAEKLIVTLSTVKKTLENIFRKLNANDRANAVAIAFIHKIIDEKLLAETCIKYKIPEYKLLKVLKTVGS